MDKVKEFKTCLECWRKANLRKRGSSGAETDNVAAATATDAMFHYIAAADLPDQAVWPHPTLSVKISTDSEAYAQFHIRAPPLRAANITAIADTGAQTCLMGLPILHKLGLTKKHLHPTSKRIFAANNEEIKVLGAVFFRISGCSGRGRRFETPAAVYVTDSTDRFYLSRIDLVRLGIVGPEFPQVGAAVAAAGSVE